MCDHVSLQGKVKKLKIAKKIAVGLFSATAIVMFISASFYPSAKQDKQAYQAQNNAKTFQTAKNLTSAQGQGTGPENATITTGPDAESGTIQTASNTHQDKTRAKENQDAASSTQAQKQAKKANAQAQKLKDKADVEIKDTQKSKKRSNPKTANQQKKGKASSTGTKETKNAASTNKASAANNNPDNTANTGYAANAGAAGAPAGTGNTVTGTTAATPGSGPQTAGATFQSVTKDYFSDALFIGDSRTVGMQQSGLLPNATYYAKVGIGISGILTDAIVPEGNTMVTIKEALSRHSFGKVYIMIGINDMSGGDVSWFTEKYSQLLQIVRQAQPNAVIYIQGNIPMSSSKQNASYSLTNANLRQRNEASRQLADAQTIFYLDVENIYADAYGCLDTKYSTDGLHVSMGYYPYWADYLQSHAIVR